MNDKGEKDGPGIVLTEDGMPVVDLEMDPFDPGEVQPAEGDVISDLDAMLEMLQIFDVEYTLIQDESGATIEITGGSRGTHGFSGVAVTMNFGPVSRAEEFLFIGLAKL
jgi:hypothetical protein